MRDMNNAICFTDEDISIEDAIKSLQMAIDGHETRTAIYNLAIQALKEKQEHESQHPLTVGEHVRKSDESLAEFLASGTPDAPWPHCTICMMHRPGMCNGDTDCKMALILSLSRPLEKEE